MKDQKQFNVLHIDLKVLQFFEFVVSRDYQKGYEFLYPLQSRVLVAVGDNSPHPACRLRSLRPGWLILENIVRGWCGSHKPVSRVVGVVGMMLRDGKAKYLLVMVLVVSTKRCFFALVYCQLRPIS